MLVAPSILAADFLNLDKDVQLVNSHADIFHLDIMDGIFVPNISFGFPVVEAIASKAQKPLDVHLMIVEPWKYAERFARAGASMISFHYEAAQDRSRELLGDIRSMGVKAGIVINPDCPAEKIFPLLDAADFVLIMSVFAGFGGQKFIPGSLDRIKAVYDRIRLTGLDIPIEVDGGVGPDNAQALAEAGASILVAGSSVFKAPDPVQAINLMKNARR